MNLNDVQRFINVAATENFTAAAKQLGTTRSAVSRSISRLERDLGVVLLNRTTRNASLTEAGRTFYEHTAKLDEMLTEAENAVSGADQLPIGMVACTLPSCLGSALLPAIDHRFDLLYPDLIVNLQFGEPHFNLIRSGLDVAIRIAQKLEDSRLMSKRIGTTRQVLVASPGYLAKNGTPRNLDDLKEHRCLVLGDATSKRVIWRFRNSGSPIEVPIDGARVTNSSLALILSACNGIGILCVPKLTVCGELAQGRLTAFLTEFDNPQPYNIYAVWPRRKLPAKVRVFIDFVEQELPSLSNVERWEPLAKPSDG